MSFDRFEPRSHPFRRLLGALVIAVCVVVTARSLEAQEPTPTGWLLPEAVSSFGAAERDGFLYVFGGHVGRAHAHSRENLSHAFRRRSLDGRGTWESLPGGVQRGSYAPGGAPAEPPPAEVHWIDVPAEHRRSSEWVQAASAEGFTPCAYLPLAGPQGEDVLRLQRCRRDLALEGIQVIGELRKCGELEGKRRGQRATQAGLQQVAQFRCPQRIHAEIEEPAIGVYSPKSSVVVYVELEQRGDVALQRHANRTSRDICVAYR